jgi:hypothetical protein
MFLSLEINHDKFGSQESATISRLFSNRSAFGHSVKTYFATLSKQDETILALNFLLEGVQAHHYILT